MDDHTGEKNNGSRRRTESVLEQRYKELYGNASTQPEGASEAPAPPEAEAPVDSTAPEASAADAPAPAAPEKAARTEAASVNARAARTEESAVSSRSAGEKPARVAPPKEKAPPEKAAREKPASKAQSRPASRQPAPEPNDKRGSGRRVDTLERSPARRAYSQPRKQPMKLWPWALAAGLILLALAGLLVYSLLRPLPGDPAAAPTATLGPTFPSANVLTQPTSNLPTDAPTTAPTAAPTAAPTTNATATPDTNTVLRPGTSGESVKLMQRRLMELGYLAGDTADGDYGKATQEAVLHFQQAHGLTADGYAGQQTLTLLYDDSAKPASSAAEE